MLRQLKRFTVRLVAGANVASILLMLFVGFSDRANPVGHPVVASLGLAFPVVLAVNAAFLLFWLFFKPRYTLLPLAGFLAAYQPVRTYLPLNLPRPVPEEALKVVSFNVSFFLWPRDTTAAGNVPMVDYLLEQQADIVCLQESFLDGDLEGRVERYLARQYPYTAKDHKGTHDDVLRVFSRYPVVGQRRLFTSWSGNMGMAVDLLVEGDTVTVINTHFQSTLIGSDQRRNISSMVEGSLTQAEAQEASRKIMRTLGRSSGRRAPQVDSVASYIDRHPHHSIILCGDFNDSPISYTHRQLALRLTDAYRESGNGPGISYDSNRMYVRIDNILCSQDWVPYGCYVDREMALSDHYPIICWLKKRQKP